MFQAIRRVIYLSRRNKRETDIHFFRITPINAAFQEGYFSHDVPFVSNLNSTQKKMKYKTSAMPFRITRITKRISGIPKMAAKKISVSSLSKILPHDGAV